MVSPHDSSRQWRISKCQQLEVVILQNLKVPGTGWGRVGRFRYLHIDGHCRSTLPAWFPHLPCAGWVQFPRNKLPVSGPGSDGHSRLYSFSWSWLSLLCVLWLLSRAFPWFCGSWIRALCVHLQLMLVTMLSLWAVIVNFLCYHFLFFFLCYHFHRILGKVGNLWLRCFPKMSQLLKTREVTREVLLLFGIHS